MLKGQSTYRVGSGRQASLCVRVYVFVCVFKAQPQPVDPIFLDNGKLSGFTLLKEKGSDPCIDGHG